jgi:hypothetical protein
MRMKFYYGWTDVAWKILLRDILGRTNRCFPLNGPHIKTIGPTCVFVAARTFSSNLCLTSIGSYNERASTQKYRHRQKGDFIGLLLFYFFGK